VEAEEVVHRPHRRQGKHVRLQAAQRVPGLIFERVVGQLVGRVELRSVDLPERSEVMLGSGAFGSIIFVAEIVAEPIGIAHVTAEDGADRIALERRLVARLEQGKERVMLALDRLGRRRFGRSGSGGRSWRGSRDGRAAGQHASREQGRQRG
jgi:hypothetical protein